MPGHLLVGFVTLDDDVSRHERMLVAERVPHQESPVHVDAFGAPSHALDVDATTAQHVVPDELGYERAAPPLWNAVSPRSSSASTETSTASRDRPCAPSKEREVALSASSGGNTRVPRLRPTPVTTPRSSLP